MLDRLGAVLCQIAATHLLTGVTVVDGRTSLVVPVMNYAGLVDAMFHLIRQNGGDQTAVLIRMLEVLTAAAGCDIDPVRRRELRRHADLVLGDAERNIKTPSDVADLRLRYTDFARTAGTSTAARAR